jgi:hypothetical protein
VPTYQEVRRQLFDELDGYSFGFNFTASGVTTTKVTTADPRIRDSLLANGQYEGAYIVRPALSGADFAKIAGDTCGGAGSICHTGSSWCNQGACACTDFELMALHPTVFLNLANDALELEFVKWETPLVPGPTDPDMESTSAWDTTESGTTTANATVTKTTTASEVRRGARATKIVTSAADGYAQSNGVRVRQSGTVFYYAVLRSDGTARVGLRDAGGTEIDAQTTTENQWTMVYGNAVIDDDDETVHIRISGSNGATITVDEVGIIPNGHTEIPLAVPYDEPFKVDDISTVVYTQSMRGGNAYNAASRQLRKLVEGSDYRYVRHEQDANPLWIEILKPGLLSQPMVVNGNIPWSYFGGYSTDASASNVPLHVIVRRIKLLLGQRYPERFPALAAAAFQEIRMSAAAREVKAPERQAWQMPRVF